MAEPNTESHIHDILLRVARCHLGAADHAWLRAAAQGELDWTALIRTALAHGVAGLLCRHLLTALDGELPADIRAAAIAYIAEARERHAAGVAQLQDLLAAFATVGVSAIPFKGPALAEMVYAEPALRGFRDLDILIAAADIAAVMGVLAARGYQSQYPDLRARDRRAYHAYNGQDILFTPGLLPVEPHWQFGQRTLAAPIDMVAMLRRSVQIPLSGRPIRVLSPEDSVLACAYHGSKEEWASLRGVVDMAELLRAFPALDWDVLLHRAQAAGLQRMLLLGVCLARDLLGAPIPATVGQHIAADRMCQDLAARVRAKLFANGAVERSIFEFSAFRWHMRERLRDRLRYAGATICTPRVHHFGILALPAWLGFLYPVIKLGHDYVALPIWKLARPGLATITDHAPTADAA